MTASFVPGVKHADRLLGLFIVAADLAMWLMIVPTQVAQGFH